MKAPTLRWTTTIATILVLTTASVAPWTAAGDRPADPRAQRASRTGGLATDRNVSAPLLHPVFGGGAGGPAPSFGVTVSASALQDDPTSDLPIEFDVEFEQPIDPATFETADILQDGTAGGIVWEIINAGNDTSFQLRAVQVQTAGTIVPSLPAESVTGVDVATNDPSVGVGNEVVYAGAAVGADPAFVYVGMWNPGRVYTFRADPPTTLTLVGSPVDVTGDALDLAVEPDGDRLIYATGSLFALDIDPATGVPGAPVSLAAGPGNIDSLAFNSTGTKMYATQNQGMLLVFDVPGGPTDPPVIVQQVDGLVVPRGVIVDPGDDYVYVANEFDFAFSPGSQEIARYGLNGSGFVISGPSFTTYGPEPEHFAMDPCGDFLLHTEQPGRNVLKGNIGGGGAVTPGGLEPAGPGALRLLLVELGAPCGDAALYVTNVLEDTVSVFHVDGNGYLTFLEDEDTGVRPEDLIKHPTTNVLYVLNSGDFTGQSSISIYEIDPGTGELEPAGEVTIDDEGGFRLAIKDAG